MSNISAMDDGGENNIRRAGGTTRSAQMAAPGMSCPDAALSPLAIYGPVRACRQANPASRRRRRIHLPHLAAQRPSS